MRVTCLRHGETEENVAGVFCGAGAGVLTALQRSTLRTGALDPTAFDAVYCSPARRCVETAECVGLRDWIEEPRLVERHFGVFEGLTPEECMRRYPDEFAAFARLDADYAIPGGESRAQHLDRIMSWLHDAARVHDRVLAVTHGGTIDFLYRLGSGLELHGGEGMWAGPNAALSVFDVVGPEVSVVVRGRPLE